MRPRRARRELTGQPLKRLLAPGDEAQPGASSRQLARSAPRPIPRVAPVTTARVPGSIRMAGILSRPPSGQQVVI